MPAKTTKIDTVLKALRRHQGVSAAHLQKMTGWKPHSVRAALTGLRKKGHEITRDRNKKGVTIYSIVGGVQK